MIPNVDELMLRLRDAHIVGGAVRDSIMGVEPNDIDMCTSMLPEEVMSMFPESFASGAAFGTVSVKTSDWGFVEVTTFRKDMGAGRHPKVEYTDNFAEDAGRRGFTINGMGADRYGNIVDLFGGIQDISDRIIRCIGNAEDRLVFERGGDPLRALRALRFALRLHFYIDDELASVIRAIDLSSVSNERIWKEISLMLDIDPENTLDLLDEYNLLSKVMPEIHVLKECELPEKHHPNDRDRFTHTKLVLRDLQDSDLTTKIAGLCHDIGSPVVRDGVRYNGHDKAGVPIAEAMLRRFGISNKIISTVKFVVLNHMRMHTIFEMKKSKQLEIFEHRDFETLLTVHDADVSMRPKTSRREDILALRESYIVQSEMPKPIINGRDVIDNCNLKGKYIGKILDILWDMQLEGRFSDKEGGIKALKEEGAKKLKEIALNEEH